ncbi:MAG: transposase [Candidatus Competibacteraceae bacterium]|nr:transposase [Candidatus Competibacteraceae bacterium]
MLLTLKVVFDLPYQMMKGLTGSIMWLVEWAWRIPDHTLPRTR